MRISIVAGMAVLCGLFMAGTVRAQAPGGGGPGGPRGGGMGQPDPFTQTIDALGDLNLRPDFSLTADQKTKLQAIRDEVKGAETKWRTDHEAELKKFTDDAAAARQDQDQDKMREIMTKRGELMQTMPKSDDAVAKVKALLTADEAKALEARMTERQQEQRARMGGMMPGGGRGGRGGGGGGQ